MAVQQRLGLLSDRWLGGSRCRRPSAGLAWSALAGKAGAPNKGVLAGCGRSPIALDDKPPSIGSTAMML
jgi:hypothetical protein